MKLSRCTLLSFCCLFLAIYNQVAAKTCQAEFETVKSCFTQLRAKEDRAVARDTRNFDNSQKNLRDSLVTCLQNQGCKSDVSDPKHVATRECLRSTKRLIQDNLKACMEKRGNPDFTPELDATAKKGRQDPSNEKISVRAAARACEAEKGEDGVSRQVQSCVAEETSKKRTAGSGKSSTVLKTFSEINTYCNQKKQCRDRFSESCATDICECFEEVRLSQEVVGEYRSCLNYKLETTGVEGDDAENAEQILLQDSREWFPFCVPKDEDDSCDEDEGVVADVVGVLKTGEGANTNFLEAIQSGFGGQKLDLAGIASTLSGGGGLFSGLLGSGKKR